MKDDLISRQAAINALSVAQADLHNAHAVGLIRAQKIISDLPSAQAEIIVCGDCKHWSRESICDGFCSEDCMRHDEDFYCGYAERREE
jgi:hypothetical protein